MKPLVTLLILNIFFIQFGLGQTTSDNEKLLHEYGISVDFLNNALFGNAQPDFSYKAMEIKTVKTSQDATPYFQTIEKQYLTKTGKWKVISVDNPLGNDGIVEDLIVATNQNILNEQHISLIHEDAQQLIFQFNFTAKDLPKGQKHLKAFEGKFVLNKQNKSLDKIEVYAKSGFSVATVSRVRFFNATQIYKKDPKSGLSLLQRQMVKSEIGTFGNSVLVDETTHYYDYVQDIQKQNEV